MQNDVLKHQLGFQGYILSDWQATESVRDLPVTTTFSLVQWPS